MRVHTSILFSFSPVSSLSGSRTVCETGVVQQVEQHEPIWFAEETDAAGDSAHSGAPPPPDRDQVETTV